MTKEERGKGRQQESCSYSSHSEHSRMILCITTNTSTWLCMLWCQPVHMSKLLFAQALQIPGIDDFQSLGKAFRTECKKRTKVQFVWPKNQRLCLAQSQFIKNLPHKKETKNTHTAIFTKTHLNTHSVHTPMHTNTHTQQHM